MAVQWKCASLVGISLQIRSWPRSICGITSNPAPFCQMWSSATHSRSVDYDVTCRTDIYAWKMSNGKIPDSFLSSVVSEEPKTESSQTTTPTCFYKDFLDFSHQRSFRGQIKFWNWNDLQKSQGQPLVFTPQHSAQVQHGWRWRLLIFDI